MNFNNLANFYLLDKINKSNTKVSTHYRTVCFYSINICYDIFVSCEIFNFFLEYVQLQSYQSRLLYYDSHIKLSNEFLLI